MSTDPVPLDQLDRILGRWRADVTIIDPVEGEHVWLKEVTRDECAANFEAAGIDPAKAYGYVTACCFVGEECEHHRMVSETPNG